MNKKVIGIIICILFLLASIPIISGANINKNSEKNLLNTNDSIGLGFILDIGEIIYNGEEYRFWRWCYNITPINLLWIEIVIGIPPYIDIGKIKDDPFYLPKEMVPNGYINKNNMFLWGIGYA